MGSNPTSSATASSEPHARHPSGEQGQGPHSRPRRLLRPVPGRGRSDRGGDDGRFRPLPVVSVDYRMPPDAYFPAAVGDPIAVYRDLLKNHAPGNVAFFGTSAGGAITLEMVLRAKQLGLPVPARGTCCSATRSAFTASCSGPAFRRRPRCSRAKAMRNASSTTPFRKPGRRSPRSTTSSVSTSVTDGHGRSAATVNRRAAL